MIVVDTNIIASLWVPNNRENLVYQVLEKDADWIAPILWKSEFRNVLTKYLRARILEFTPILQVMEEAEQLMSQKEFAVNSSQVLSLVSDSFCSAYDCEFVVLAHDFNVKLVTFDKKIIKNFPDISVLPSQFVD